MNQGAGYGAGTYPFFNAYAYVLVVQALADDDKEALETLEVSMEVSIWEQLEHMDEPKVASIIKELAGSFLKDLEWAAGLDLTMTMYTAGNLVAITRTNSDHQIIEVLWQKQTTS